MLKHEKERVVAELAERLRAADTLFVADYRGLDVTAIDGVRTELLKHGARFSIVKNTLTKRAAEAAGVEELNEFLDGPTAIAFLTEGDMVAVAKALSDAARETRVLALKGGILDGRPISADDLRSLASLPPADVLRGQVLGAVVAPLNAIVGLVAAPLRELVGVVDARIRQLEEQGEAAEPPAAEREAAASASGDSEPEGEAADETAEEPRDNEEG
jgi:large subunit ribosomal protein L10